MTQIRKNIAGYNNLYQVSNMNYTVYLIKHIITGQVLYVGKTDNFKRRAHQHLSLNTNSKEWLSSIGTGNVLIEAVADFENKDDALKYEDELILKYNTITNGYNNNRSGLIASENPEEYNKKYQKKYREIDEHKEHMREYHRKYKKEYRNTEEYKEYDRKWHRDYYYSKKMGISVSEYRKLKNDQDATLEQNKKQPIQLTINFN